MNSVSYFLAKTLIRLVRKCKKIYEKINLCYLRGEFRHLGQRPLIELPFSTMNPQCISIGDDFIARPGVTLRAYTSYEEKQFDPIVLIGNNVHLAAGSLINCTNRIEIGDHSGIGVGSKLMDHAHGLPGYEDLQTVVMKREVTSKGGIIIGRNVMVGTGVVILAGVQIGDNSIVGSNSVVTRSIPPNSIAVGIPAKVIKTLPG